MAGERTPVALTIAGSDSGGGAGIQADLKAFAACGVHGASAITAITAQNTVGVSAIQEVAPEMVLAQIRAVIGDIGVDAVKIGMLGTVRVVETVARALGELPRGTPVVVDPVMVAESGARLLRPDAERALVREILPRTTVLTPNVPEARALAAVAGGTEPEVAGAVRSDATGVVEPHVAGGGDEQEAQLAQLARAVLALGPRAIVLTGGHRRRAVDLFLEARSGGGAAAIVEIPGERHPDGAAHGSGCTHSAVLAARLALGDSPLEAARVARQLAGEAVGRGLRELGGGAGPVDVIDLRGRRGVT
ncbi:MAG TPA: bifunctional hydroxymethylpyrimidine kinase/phosphomethylpyrimidine kinase [Solirubrobacteraceae bacterium]|nr:bifunctional hydroxymethylpyrimidine kinase/phosphomethylpyrimidine kinase [Solirubrobacteraceae bacterium]